MSEKGAEMKVQLYTVTMQNDHTQEGQPYVAPYTFQCHIAAYKLSDALKQARDHYESVNGPGSFDLVQNIHAKLLRGDIVGLL